MSSPIQSDLDAFHQIIEAPEGRCLQEVYEVVEADCRGKLYLQFQKQTLVLEANADLDTLAVQCEDSDGIAFPALVCVSQAAPWQEMIGRDLRWGWTTVNHQGYCDGAMLSFTDFTPNLVLNVTGSSIHIYQVLPMTTAPAGVVSSSNGFSSIRKN